MNEENEAAEGSKPITLLPGGPLDVRTNLLKETLGEMEKHGKYPSDVMWVGTASTFVEETYSRSGAPAVGTWADFAALADFTYDSGFGGAEVNQGLVVVGTDWWLERHEYDGSEWWEFKTLPVRPATTQPLTASALRDR